MHVQQHLWMNLHGKVPNTFGACRYPRYDVRSVFVTSQLVKFQPSSLIRMWYRITQKRSTIGLPKKLRNTALAMGLSRRGNVVYQRVNAANAGQILALKELLEVQIVDKALSREEERLMSRRPPGYTVETSE